MARAPKAFCVRGKWYTEMGGTRQLLAEGVDDEEAANLHLQQLMAERTARKIQAKRERRSQKKIKSGRKELTVREASQRYDRQAEEKGSQDRAREYNSKVLRKLIGRRKLSSITQVMARKVLRHLQKKQTRATRKKKARLLKPKTIRHIINYARALWNWAREEELLGENQVNPFSNLKSESPEPRQRTVTEEEFGLIKEKAHPWLLEILLFLRYSAARPGEARALLWTQVDLERRLCILTRHKTRKKTNKPRIIPLSDEALTLLRTLREKAGTESHVFLNSKGRPWKKEAFESAVNKLVTRCDLGEDENGERISAYNLRHTMLTDAAKVGMTAFELQSLAGWTSPAMASTYIHLAGQDAINAIDKLNRLRKGES